MRHPSLDPTTAARREAEFDQAETRYQVDELQRRWGAEDRALEQAAHWRTREVAELKRRVAALERLTSPGGDLLAAIGEATGKVAGQVRRELTARIKSLEDRQLVFRGVHEPGQAYAPGALVVRSGGLRHCNTSTTDVPGKSGCWTLAVKSGSVDKPGIA